MANGNGLASIEHVVVLMLEIREELESRRLPAGAHYLPPGGALA